MEQGFLEHVPHGGSKWASSIVVLRKTYGDLQICGDYKFCSDSKGSNSIT